MKERLDKLIQGEIEESELSRGRGDEALAGKGVRRNRSKSQMLSLRISSDDYKAIEDVSSVLDLPVSALVRGWILDGLAQHRDSTAADVVERVAADVERLRNIVGR